MYSLTNFSLFASVLSVTDKLSSEEMFWWLFWIIVAMIILIRIKPYINIDFLEAIEDFRAEKKRKIRILLAPLKNKYVYDDETLSLEEFISRVNKNMMNASLPKKLYIANPSNSDKFPYFSKKEIKKYKHRVPNIIKKRKYIVERLKPYLFIDDLNIIYQELIESIILLQNSLDTLSK